ncbi:hypothetical protein RJ639_014638 [Escallonia herrerae]|uniref:Uncharacterized protein n=1 Tax=Escallonia herrerae TaxID=1293975 RepID=A0AA89APJ1_9ASTE|nr:hypothetical protein RJ639_014638 [Escallonia herrerae]
MAESCIGGVEEGRGGDVGGGAYVYASIPRGGPIFVPDMAGPLTKVSDFESTVYQQLQDLEKEVSCASSSSHTFDDDGDLLVDDLKILTEEELVNKAFEVAFEDDEVDGNASQVSKEYPNAGKPDDDGISGTKDACLESSERVRDAVQINDSPSKTVEHGQSEKMVLRKRKGKRHIDWENVEHRQSEKMVLRNRKGKRHIDWDNDTLEECKNILKKSKKKRNTLEVHKNISRKRRKRRVNWKTDTVNIFSKLHVQESYIAKVEQLAKIKQKQDEDKAAARLHSFKYVVVIFMASSHWHLFCVSVCLSVSLPLSLSPTTPTETVR